MKFNFKRIKPTYLYIAGATAAFIILLAWHLFYLKTSSSSVSAPKPVSEIPRPLTAKPLPDSEKQPAVHTEQIKQNLDLVPLDVKGRAGLQYVGRHPPFDINSISDAEEDVQEHPATVDYGSPDPFQFEPHPEWAVSGTGYAYPSNEHANEMFARIT